jgi:hypothetical protein
VNKLFGIVLALLALLTSASAAASDLYHGRALGVPLGSAVASAPGATVDVRPGTMVLAVLQANGVVASGLGVAVSGYDTAGFNGWGLEFPQAGVAGCPSGNCVWLISNTIEWESPIAVPQQGVHAVCVAWMADTTVGVAVDGVWYAGYGSLSAPSAVTSTWNASIGGPTAMLTPYGRAPYPGRVLALATWPTPSNWSASAVASYCRAATYASGDPLHLPLHVAQTATYAFDADHDFAKPTFSTQGGAVPIAYTVTGSSPPALTAVEERRIRGDELSDYFVDGVEAGHYSDASAGWTSRSPYTRIKVLTDGGYVTASAYTITSWTAPKEQLSGWLNGSFVGQALLEYAAYPLVPHSPAFATFGGPEAPGNLFEVRTGLCDCNDYAYQPRAFGGWWCTNVLDLVVPTLRYDGVTPARTVLVPRPPPPAKVVVFVGEALLDWNASAPAATSVVGLLRAAYPSDGIRFVGAASMAAAELAARPNSAQLIARALDGTASNVLWWTLARGDAYGPVGDPPAAFQTAVQSVLNGVCAAKPGLVVYLQGAVQIPAASAFGGEVTNGYGANLGSYRAVESTIAASSCPTGCTCRFVTCAAGACVNDSNYDNVGVGEGVFLTDAGLAQYEGFIASTLSGAGLL